MRISTIILCALFSLTTGLKAQFILDTSFKDTGTYSYNTELQQFIPRKTIVGQENNLFVAGGIRKKVNANSIFEADSILKVVNILPNGDLNQAFGQQGVFQFQFPEAVQVKALYQRPNGFIISLLKGAFFNQTNNLNFIAKITVDGNLDSSFASNGILDFRDKDVVQIAPDFLGNIYILSTDISSGMSEIVFEKINSIGQQDSTFANNGELRIQIPKTKAEDIIITPDNIYGICQSAEKFFKYRVIKLDTVGNIDSSYGVNGLAESAIFEFDFGIPVTGHLFSRVFDGRVYLGGQSNNTTKPNHLCVIDKTGMPLKSFNDSGLVQLDSIVFGEFLVLNNFEILLLSNDPTGHSIKKLDNNGRWDSSFGSNGVLRARISENSNEFPLTITSTDDGFFVTGISKSSNDSLSLAISKFTSNSVHVGNISENHREKIFPNPTQNYLYVGPELEKEALQVFNTQGQEFHLDPVINSKLDVNHLQPGVYFIRAGERVWRFVKE